MINKRILQRVEDTIYFDSDQLLCNERSPPFMK